MIAEMAPKSHRLGHSLTSNGFKLPFGNGSNFKVVFGCPRWIREIWMDLSNGLCGPLNEGNPMRMGIQNSNAGSPNTPTRAEGTVADIIVNRVYPCTVYIAAECRDRRLSEAEHRCFEELL